MAIPIAFGSVPYRSLPSEALKLDRAIIAIQRAAAMENENLVLSVERYDDRQRPGYDPAGGTILQKWGWDRAKRMAGLPSTDPEHDNYDPRLRRKDHYSIATIDDALRRAAAHEDVSGALSLSDYLRVKKPDDPATTTIWESHSNGWNGAKTRAGLELSPLGSEESVSREEARRSIIRTFLGSTVDPSDWTIRAYDARRPDDAPSGGTIARKFGWRDFCDEAFEDFTGQPRPQ